MMKKLAFLLCLALIFAAPAYARVVDMRIATAMDDIEERLETNLPNNNSDLEMPYENTNKRVPQLTALRYQIPLPKGVQITKAYVEFTVDEDKGGTQPVNLVIDGQLTPNAPAFTTAAKDLSGRTGRTEAKVKWAVENWTTVGQKSQTPDLSVILQEIFDQKGWASGNALVLFFGDDPGNPSEGVRCADAYDDGADLAPRLYIETFIPVAASLPSPPDGGVWQRSDTTVAWEAGSGAVSHTVYGGTDKAAVAAGDPSVLLGTSAETSFALSGLTPLTVYYWRVDEVDAAGAVVPGSIWSFHVVGANTGSWRTAAEPGGPGFLATYVADGLYDIGAFSGDITYEFVVRGNPDEQEASMCLIGRRDFGDTKAGLKYEQWNNTKTYGATVFGVADHDFKVPNAPGEYTHLAFVSSETAKRTDLYVNGVLKGSVPTAITLSGSVGIGCGAQNRPPADPFFDNFDGDIFGVAIYDRALSDAEIAANSAAFLLGGPEAVALDIRIANGDDDYEERISNGVMDVGSTDLELAYETAGNPARDEQWVGLRFVDLQIPKGAKVAKAYLEFEVDSVSKVGSANPVNLIIEGELTPNAPVITSAAKGLTSRGPWTVAKTKWSVPPWTKVDEKFQTTDLAAVLQEIIDQDGWASGNALLLLLRDDKDNPSTGLREAESFEGEPAAAPLLHIEFLIF